MFYTQPRIISTLTATSAIQSFKNSPTNLEINLLVPTNGPAYQAEE
jgi:hypothetical protein